MGAWCSACKHTHRHTSFIVYQLSQRLPFDLAAHFLQVLLLIPVKTKKEISSKELNQDTISICLHYTLMVTSTTSTITHIFTSSAITAWLSLKDKDGEKKFREIYRHASSYWIRKLTSRKVLTIGPWCPGVPGGPIIPGRPLSPVWPLSPFIPWNSSKRRWKMLLSCCLQFDSWTKLKLCLF